MSLPKVLVESYKAICECELVKNKDASQENINVFKTLLNNAQKATSKYLEYRYIIKSMYLNNPNNFMRYISNKHNKVEPLILWTESKRIIHAFDLYNMVHLIWNKGEQQYEVIPYKVKPKRAHKADKEQVDYTDDNIYSSLVEEHDDDTPKTDNVEVSTNTEEVFKDAPKKRWADME